MAKLSAWLRSKSSPNLVNIVILHYVLDSELAHELEKRSRDFTPQADRVLFLEGDPPHGVYFLKEGEVTLSMKSSNRNLISLQADGGALVGLPSVVSNKPYTMTATASIDAKLRRLEVKNFHILLETRPEISMSILRIMAEEIRSERQVLGELLS
jgi:CRP-like cAMP-binding protein